VLPPRAVQELGDALALLRHVRALLAVFFPTVPQPAELKGAVGASLARCAGAIDFARLDAELSAACARVRFWYDRLIARPARRVAATRIETPTGDQTR
jgi:glutathione S-transferase